MVLTDPPRHARLRALLAPRRLDVNNRYPPPRFPEPPVGHNPQTLGCSHARGSRATAAEIPSTGSTSPSPDSPMATVDAAGRSLRHQRQVTTTVVARNELAAGAITTSRGLSANHLIHGPEPRRRQPQWRRTHPLQTLSGAAAIDRLFVRLVRTTPSCCPTGAPRYMCRLV